MTDDMSAFLEDYLSEADEHLQALNKSLLALEKNPEDSDAINSIFRSAHTLKSSSAAMGFIAISGLAHAMEDLLGKVRSKEMRATRAVVDLIFTCFDKLESMIDSVGKTGQETGDTSALIDKLHEMMQDGATGQSNTENNTAKKVSGKDIALPSKPPSDSLEDSPINQDGLIPGESLVEGAEGAELANAPHTLRSVMAVKVSMSRLDKLMDLVGELLINKMRLQQIQTTGNIKDLGEPISHLDRLTSELQFEVMQARLIPMEHIFNRFPRMVRDIASQEGKKVNFIIEGGDIELDRTVIDEIGEPLIHLLRNAVDHGIESPSERIKEGKSEEATIKVIARRERNGVVVEVEDDGQGFDLDEVRATAVKKGIISQSEAAKLTDRKALDLPFNPGYSTSTKVTDVSGRGVGLNVVKSKILSLNGSVRVETEKGHGSRFILELPPTLAIVQSFLIKVGNDHFAIPLSNVVRTIRVERDAIKTISGYTTFILDKEDIPLVFLDRLFSIQGSKGSGVTVVIVEKGNEKAGLAVDSILGKQDLLIKPLDKTLKDAKGFSGCTILGDGTVALALDLNSLI